MEELYVCVLMEQGKLQSFLAVAAQTLESFVGSLDTEVKTEDHNSQEHQFVLALAGTITNVAAVPCGRNFLSSSLHILLDTLMKLLEQMKPGVFPKLKVLMLMALYNVSINVNGLRYISENPRLITLIWTLLNDGDWEVCLHSLRLLQSVLLEEEAVLLLGSSLLDPDLQARVSHLTSSSNPSLRAAAQQTLEDLQALQQYGLLSNEQVWSPLNKASTTVPERIQDERRRRTAAARAQRTSLVANLGPEVFDIYFQAPPCTIRGTSLKQINNNQQNEASGRVTVSSFDDSSH